MKRIARIVLKLVRMAKRYLNDPSLLYARSNDPDFMIIGAQKSGTSSLYNWLNQHPQIRGSICKELYYFNNGIHLGKDLRWYRQQFRGTAALHFEATPAYLYSPTACENIFRTYPNIKMIAILRNPVDRAYSAYNHHRSNFAEWSRSDALKNKQGLPRNRLYTSFLGADPFDWSCVSICPQNQRSYEEALNDKDRAFLEAYHYLSAGGKNDHDVQIRDAHPEE
jgi:hypothetical protein